MRRGFGSFAGREEGLGFVLGVGCREEDACGGDASEVDVNEGCAGKGIDGEGGVTVGRRCSG